MRALAPEFTLVIIFLDHRLAFLALAALVVGAAIPLAFAWARILPEDRPPFEIEPPSYPTVEMEPPPTVPRDLKRRPIAILLLAGLTIGYLFQFPGFPRDAIFRWMRSSFSAPADWVSLGVYAVVIIVAVGAGVYALWKPGPLRLPLVAAAALVLLLWLLAPFLRTALLAV